jgi:ArsR family transcriptional regulator, arsenate/arsenite/antimonite-responsive transcriptional repressor
MSTSEPSLQLQSDRFKALGHPSRLAILRRVVQGPPEGTPAGELQAGLGIPGSTLSHHLSELAQAGLITAAREGTTIRYAVAFDQLRALTDYLWESCCGGGCNCT